ncbi:MAG TPA: LacI family transcriptional regulator [Bacteroidetes bacterium]|nr:LacI family transcriptional regulator [Bacteroidota bacterium]
MTLKDLAIELKTSPSTVSRSLQDHGGISPEMKKKVRELAAKREYRVNSFASNLRTGTRSTIGVIVPMINRDFFSNVIAGIEKKAFEKKFNAIICQSHNKIENEIKHINTLIESNVAAIFVSLSLNTTDFSHFERASKQGIPLIFFDRVPEKTEAVKIVIDDEHGAYKATEHLIKMGYQRIAHFAGSDHINIYKERKKGYMRALSEHGIKTDGSLIVNNTLEMETGKQAIEKLLSLPQPPDALFAASDYSALGAYTYLRDHNISMPADFGIVGFGNEKVTGLLSPGLSSVDQYSIGIGICAFEAFYDKYVIKDKKPTKKIQLEPTLIVRGSSLRKKQDE